MDEKIDYKTLNISENSENIISNFIKESPLSRNELYTGPHKKTEKHKIYKENLWKKTKILKTMTIEKEDQLGFYCNFYVKNNKKDLDNLLKGFIDFLQEKLKFNDNQIMYISCEKFFVENESDEGIQFYINKL